MKAILLLIVVAWLGVQQGNGAPSKAAYKFVKCNPEGNQANCVTYQSPEMEWTPDLPAKLPASTAQYIEAKLDEGESPPVEDDKKVMDTPVTGEGSGDFEGSAADYIPVGASSFETAEYETGSGDGWADNIKGLDTKGRRRSFPDGPLFDEAKPAEQDLKEDHLLEN